MINTSSLVPWVSLCLGSFLGVLPTAVPALDVIQQFDGLNVKDPFNEINTPPDPHGAVGPNGVLASVNTALAYYPKRGATNRAAIWKAPLARKGQDTNAPSFWAPNVGFGATGSASAKVADPKAVYDPDLQRFFVIMQENPGAQSFINVAVSRNNDPRSPNTADWFFYRWEVTERWTVSLPLDAGTLVEVAVGVDYPGISVDRRVLVLSFNSFSLDAVNGLQGSSLGSRVFVFDKNKLAVGLNDKPRTWTSMRPLGLPVNVGATLTLQPAQPIGNANPGNRILLTELRLKSPYIPDEWCIRLHVIDDPLGRFDYDYDDIDIDRPGPYQDWLLGKDLGAPQPTNGIRLNTIIKRCMNAIFFDGKVWTVYTQPGEGGDNAPTVIHWVAIEPRVGQSVVAEDNYFDNTGTGGWLYMPAIGASPRGDLCIVYTESGTGIVPTIKARIRQKGDLSWGNELTIKKSASPSVATPKLGETWARWGDYAAVLPDPVDGTLWVTHEYVNTGDTNDWSTTWAQLAGCNFPLVGNPGDTNIIYGAAPASFSVGASDLFGDPLPATTVGYDWRHNGIVLTNTSLYRVTTNLMGSSLDVLTPRFADEGWYDVVVTNACGFQYAAVSQPALLTMQSIPTWATVDAGPQPLNRINHRMAHVHPPGYSDSITVLLGGEVFDPVRYQRFITNDMWFWSGPAGWKPVPEYNQYNPPPPRAQHAMAFDSRRGKLVLFGGYYDDAKTNIVYRDTWEWNGVQWAQFFPSNSPPARYNHTMAYDSVRGETLLMGGHLNSPESEQTWAWDGVNWSLRSTNVPPRLISTYLGPYSVYDGTVMAFDERHGTAVHFGPYGDSATRVWEWTGGYWSSKDPSPVGGPSEGVVDSRSGSAFYDSYRGMVGFVAPGAGYPYIFYWRLAGGSSPNRYLRFDQMMDGAPGSLPLGAQVIYDAANRVLLAFGGGASGNFYNEQPRTRVLAFSDTPISFQQPASTNVTPGQAIRLRAAVSGGGQLTYAWYHNGERLAASARVSGVATPALQINPAQGSDRGAYQLVVNGAYGTLASSAVQVGVGPVLNWAFIGNRLQFRWTGPTVVMEEAPDPAGPWTPHPEWSSPKDISIAGSGMKYYRLSMPGL